MTRHLTIPIELHLDHTFPSEAPVSGNINLTPSLKIIGPDEIIDLHSVKLFELKKDLQQEVPVQFSPGPNYKLDDNISGTVSWIAQRNPSDTSRKNYLLQVDVENSNEVRSEPCLPYGRRVFYPDGKTKPISQFPRVQVVPQPYRLSFQRDGFEVLAYNFDLRVKRPYFYPLIGPSGVCITRISHPHDPVGHSHHHSIWLGNHDINGEGYWNDSDKSGTQVHKKFVKYEDGSVFAQMISRVDWVDQTGSVVLEETKDTKLYPVENDQIIIDLELSFKSVVDVKFGKTPFAFLGVRVAKSMGVYDGNGIILNSEGMVNEKEVFWKRAQWCDFSGAIAPGRWNGVAIFDHPNNFSHPSPWHVRNDGWFSPALFLESELALPKSGILKLKYRILAHDHDAQLANVSSHYRAFASPPEVEIKMGNSQIGR